MGQEPYMDEFIIEMVPSLWTPLKQFKSEIPIYEIRCKESLVLVAKNDGSPACVKADTASSLAKRGWGLSYDLMLELVENSDAIITGMVVGEDIRPNGERHIWLGSYEWLIKGIYDDQQLFLEQSRNNPQGLNVPFSRGEEVLLFLQNVDVKRGAYDIFSLDDSPAQKYPVNLRDVVASVFDHELYIIKSKSYDNDENCSLKLFGNDQYHYCTTKESSYVPVETLMEGIRNKLLENISEKYLEEHYDLIVIFDEPEPVIEPKSGSPPYSPPEKAARQSIEFTFSIDGVDFVYGMRTIYDEDLNQIDLRYIPPKEIQSIANSEAEINEMIYSCLDAGTYKFLYTPAYIAYHTQNGFSPAIGGHGPPSVYDRWSDDPVQYQDRVFRLWLEKSEVDCAPVHQEFEPDYSKRHDKILLIDSIVN